MHFCRKRGEIRLFVLMNQHIINHMGGFFGMCMNAFMLNSKSPVSKTILQSKHELKLAQQTVDRAYIWRH
jgi:hypothetical protein